MNSSGRDRWTVAGRVARALMLWLLALVLTFVGVYAAARWISTWLGVDPAAVDAGLIATFAGVVGGVPVALLLTWLARRESRRDDEARERSKRTRLLQVLARDLTSTLEEIRSRDRLGATAPFVRHDVWQAVSASGQLELIDDVELLEVLARAYYAIATTAEFERNLWNAMHDPKQFARRVDATTREDVTTRHIHGLMDTVRNQDDDTTWAIERAIAHLTRLLGTGSAKPDGD